MRESLNGILLQYASADYRQKLGRGLSMILNGILAQIVVGVLGVVAVFALGQGSAVTVSIAVASLAITVVLIAGYWFYTEPDPGYTGLEKPNSARQVARVAVVAQAAIQVAQLVLTVIAPQTPPATAGASAAAATPGEIVLMAVDVALSLAALGAWATQFFAVMLYTRWLGTRIPDATVINKARSYMWLLPVLTTVGIVALGLGPLIALVMYWNLLDRVRKHVRSIAATGVAAALPGKV